MTRRVAALVLVAACAGCAATSSRGVMPNAGTSGQSVAPGGAHPLNAQADSATLTIRKDRVRCMCARPWFVEWSRNGQTFGQDWPTEAAADSFIQVLKQTKVVMPHAPDSAWIAFTAPRYGGGCEPDTAKPLRGGVTVTVLKLNEVQPPFYRRGIEADSAGWDSVRVFNVPVVAARLVGRAPSERCSVRVAAGLYTTVASNVAGSSCWSRYVRAGQ